MPSEEKLQRERVMDVDFLGFIPDSAKRELDATSWAIALAAPGLFAGLAQVATLFTATRASWLFGYIFGAMILLLVGSILMGLRNHVRLHAILSVHTSMQSNRLMRQAMQEWVVAEWKAERPDIERINNYSDKVTGYFEDAKRYLDNLQELQSERGVKASIHQQLMLKYAYILFILIILTSDFSKLL